MATVLSRPTDEPLPLDSETPPATPGPSESGASATPSEETTGEPAVVLDIRNLTTQFFTYDGVVKALDGVSLKIRRGETIGLVGETGCGKSVTAFSVTRLISDPPGRVISGRVMFRDANLLWGLEREATFKPAGKSGRVKVRRWFRRIKAANERMAAIRGRRISMIFQEPTQAMNPVFSISNQIGELLLLHRGAEVFDGMLGATPNAPEVPAAIDALVEAGTKGDNTEMRAAATALGRAVNLPSFGTESFYLVKAATPAAANAAPRIRRALGRLRLGSFERSYLHHQKHQYELRQKLNEVYVTEMRTEEAHPAARGRAKLALSRGRITHFYFGIQGIRSRLRRPLDKELFWRSVQLLEGMSIANPVQVARGFPFELSGGMLQRVMIAMALSSEPEVLLADEPTTALDVTIQAQILELMRDLKSRVGTAILLITHDLAVIAEVADRVAIMYAGVVVEQGPVLDIFRRPLHPYAQGLLASIPRIDQPEKELASIPGSVPDLIHPPNGCRFHPRCPYAMPICKETKPPMTVEGSQHTVACYLYKGPVASE
jgi:peptide/nickel transport system ATP-binding protein